MASTSVKFTPPVLPDTGFDNTDSYAQHLFSQANAGLATLSQTSIEQRIEALKGLYEQAWINREQLIDALMAECGKTRTDANIEFLGSMDWIKWLIQHAKRYLKDQKVTTPILLMGKKSKIIHEPLGVVLIISPWNYPVHLALTQIATAFICGNSTIYKPSEITPMVGVIESLLQPLPTLSASVQIAYGTGDLGKALIDQRPEKIFFTGSTKTGIAITTQAAQYLIPVDTELGGNDAMIVFESANLQRAAAAAVWGAFTHNGQSCSAVERLYVQSTVYDELVTLVKQETQSIIQSIDDPDGSVDIGRVTVDFQFDIIERHVKDAIEKGASVFTGVVDNSDATTLTSAPTPETENIRDSKNTDGHTIDRHQLLYAPTVLTNVDHNMLTMSEETFGPVLPIMAFESEAEVIALANDSRYGLQASVFSDDMEQAERVAKQLEVGGVSINNVNMVEGNPWLSFGGRKQTGSGRARGLEGLYSYTRSKHILLEPNSQKREANWYPYTSTKFNQLLGLMNAMFNTKAFSLPKMALKGLKLEKISQNKRNE